MSERTFHERPETIRGHKYIRLKSGRLVTFWDMLDAAERSETDLARAVSRAFKLADNDLDQERLEWLIEELESYVGALRHAVEKRRGRRTREERIKRLRLTTGRTSEEAALFRRKADELERALDNG